MTGPTGSNGKSRADYETERAAVRDAETVTVRCCWCGYTYTGLHGRARQLAKRHRETRHPERIVVRKRNRPVWARRKETA